MGGGGPANIAGGCTSLDDELEELGLSSQELGDASLSIPRAAGFRRRGRDGSASKVGAS